VYSAQAGRPASQPTPGGSVFYLHVHILPTIHPSHLYNSKAATLFGGGAAGLPLKPRFMHALFSLAAAALCAPTSPEVVVCVYCAAAFFSLSRVDRNCMHRKHKCLPLLNPSLRERQLAALLYYPQHNNQSRSGHVPEQQQQRDGLSAALPHWRRHHPPPPATHVQARQGQTRHDAAPATLPGQHQQQQQ
jgi:hypothetical protein